MSCQLKIVTRGLASICLKRKGYFGKQRTFLIEQNPDLWSPLPAGHTVPGHRAPAASLWQPALQSSATPGLMKRLLSLVSHHSVNARKKEKEVFHRNGVRTVGLLEECQLYVRQNVMDIGGYDCFLLFEWLLVLTAALRCCLLVLRMFSLSWMPAQHLPLPSPVLFHCFPLQLSAVLLCLLPQILQRFLSSCVSQSQSQPNTAQLNLLGANSTLCGF